MLGQQAINTAFLVTGVALLVFHRTVARRLLRGWAQTPRYAVPAAAGVLLVMGIGLTLFGALLILAAAGP